MCIRDSLVGGLDIFVAAVRAGADMDLVDDSTRDLAHRLHVVGSVGAGGERLKVRHVVADDLAAVSYTHLDVYKRQLLCFVRY